MIRETNINKKISIFIYLIIFFSFAYTITVGTNWHSEPGTLANSGIYEKYGERLELSEKSKNHREFLGGMSGDAIHYIMIATVSILSSKLVAIKNYINFVRRTLIEFGFDLRIFILSRKLIQVLQTIPRSLVVILITFTPFSPVTI